MQPMREIILTALRENDYISGEHLAKKLGISRMAVWKHINELREKGYKIDSLPRRGYALVSRTTLLLPEEIKSNLNTNVMGKTIVHKYAVKSTQDIAEQLAREGATEGTVVVAEQQTQGRGRMDRYWASPGGVGIYLSLILKPDVSPRQFIQIPLVAGVALSLAIEQVSRLRPGLRWPNDIVLGGKKAAGILTEMSSEMDRIRYVILGIGVNVNTPKSRLPESIRDTATSMAVESGKRFSRVALVQCLLAEFEMLYDKYLSGGFAVIRGLWQSRNLTAGHLVKVTAGAREVAGEALDIDSEGFLLVRDRAGVVETILSGDVSIIDADKNGK